MSRLRSWRFEQAIFGAVAHGPGAHPVTHENEPCIGLPGPGPRPGLGRGLGPGPCPGLRPGPGYVAGRFEQEAIFGILDTHAGRLYILHLLTEDQIGRSR